MGLEITSAAVRASGLEGGAKGRMLFARMADLPAGLVSETYASPNVDDVEKLASLIKAGLNGTRPRGTLRAAGLSLPDGIFRVQTIEFDSLPKKAADRERLIRWRLEKSAAFDLSDTLLRHQVLPRQDGTATMLVCVAKKSVIGQYESVLIQAGLEPWSIGPSSLFTLNFYAPVLSQKFSCYALAHVTDDSFATVVAEKGGVRFYRFKDMKRGGAEERRMRLVREIEDSVHFFSHMGRSQQSELAHVYLSGELPGLEEVARELQNGTSLAVDVLTPGAVFPSFSGTGPEMAAALGAGRL